MKPSLPAQLRYASARRRWQCELHAKERGSRCADRGAGGRVFPCTRAALGPQGHNIPGFGCLQPALAKVGPASVERRKGSWRRPRVSQSTTCRAFSYRSSADLLAMDVPVPKADLRGIHLAAASVALLPAPSVRLPLLPTLSAPRRLVRTMLAALGSAAAKRTSVRESSAVRAPRARHCSM